MPVRAVFETATIADAIKKAARVAPAKGQAFDKAAGILLEVAPDITTVRATNLEVFYTEWIDPVEVEGMGTWRLPAQLLASVLGSLPIGTGKQVVFEQNDRVLKLAAGRTRAQFNLIDPEYYPVWLAFNPDDLIAVPDMGGRIGQVSWASSKNPAEAPLCGVHFDGNLAIATDRYRFSVTPLKVDGLQRPVTIPGATLSQVLSNTGEVSIGFDDRQMLVLPDEHTQIRCITYDQAYPKIDRVMKRDHPNKVTLRKSDFLDIINRALNFTGSDRTPTMRIFIGSEEIAVMMNNSEIGMLGDVVEVPGQCDHKRFEVKFTPKNLMDALNNAPNEEVTLCYNPESPGNFRIDGGSGYEAWIAPRRDSGEGS